ncbi:MAG: NAD-dependent epimerase/dehydratase family protein [Bacteroidota bacterium]
MKQKVLITGASGFVGSWLVQEALERDLHVYAGIRRTSSRSLLQDPRIEFCEIDFENQGALAETLSQHKFDYVIHNAGITRAQRDEDYYRVNCDYSTQLARLWLDAPGTHRKYVYISSVESHGSADDTPNQIVTSSTEPQPRTTYGLSKLKAERELKQIASLPLIIMRPTAVFGPAERDFYALFKTINRFGFAPVVGSKDIRYSFIYVKDLTRVVLDAMLSDHVDKGYFITDGELYPISKFTDGIAKAVAKKTWGITIPFSLLDGVVAVTGILDRLSGKKSLLNDEQLAKMKARIWNFDTDSLVRDFDFRPRYSLEEALQETVEWYKEHGWL